MNALLVLPEWLMPYGGMAEPALATESLVLVGALLLVPGRLGRWLAPGVVVLLLVTLALALSDLGTYWALGRPLNLYIDLPLAASVEHLLRGAIGKPLAWLVLGLAAAMVVLIAWQLSRWLTGLVAMRWHAGIQGLGLCLVLVGLTLGHWREVPAIDRFIDAPLSIRLTDQVARTAATAREHRRFPERLADLPPSRVSLDRLAGRDVIMGFVESYGVVMTTDARYQAIGTAALEALDDELQAAGLDVVTGHFDSPVQGGQSWLAHGTALSGLWLDSQIRYDLFLAEGRSSLIDDFEREGYRSVAVMPAITKPWPAGKQWGYDQIHDDARIDYAGPALNWVTMPDQYTWHYFENQVRHSSDEPVFAELALISSHAPWTPILERLDWDTLGDGEVFQRYAEAGPSPAAVWGDRDRIRRHYAEAVDYALRTAGEWAARYLDDGVLVLLGDHQPAPLITGDAASRSVPVHIIASDASLLADFEAQGFSPGPQGAAAPLGSLADLRGVLLTVLEQGADAPQTAAAGAAMWHPVSESIGAIAWNPTAYWW